MIRIKLIRLAQGERLPILIDYQGLPLFYPNNYALSMLRGSNEALNTVALKQQTLRFFYSFCSLYNINIENRFSKGEYLDINEINLLEKACKMTYAKLMNTKIDKNTSKILSIYKNKLPINKNNNEYVTSFTQSFRLKVIEKYLKWLSNTLASWTNSSNSNYIKKINDKKEMLEMLNARSNNTRRRSSNPFAVPEGFSRETMQRIIDVIRPEHPDNPWKDNFIKIRNQAYVLLSLSTGLRRGESLSIKLNEIDWSSLNIFIRKIPDDPDEYRKVSPQVKTLERYIPIEPGLLWPLREYVKMRSKLAKARKNPYLFVSKLGMPLTYNGAGDIFIALRKISGVPDNLKQHLIRKAWNQRISEEFESNPKAAGYSNKFKDILRKYRMGWSKNSKMASKYNIIHIINSANQFTILNTSEVFNRDNK